MVANVNVLDDPATTKPSYFETAVKNGLQESSALILKTSSKCVKKVKDAPIGQLAINVDQTLKTFVGERGDGQLLRFNLMADGLVKLVVQERGQKFHSLETPQKLKKIGEAFGFMIGITVVTSVVQVFLLQAADNLSKREDLSEDAKALCVNYIKDVFNVIILTLSDQLDSRYKLGNKEKTFFANLLQSNQWQDVLNVKPSSPEQNETPQNL